jgi:hypothetical protein
MPALNLALSDFKLYIFGISGRQSFNKDKHPKARSVLSPINLGKIFKVINRKERPRKTSLSTRNNTDNRD